MDSREAANELAIPTIRKMVRNRRNAVNHSKVDLINRCNTAIRRALRAAFLLGVTPDDLYEGMGDLCGEISKAIRIESQAVKILQQESAKCR